MQALGFIEAPFLGISAMLAHEAATTADVHILGFEDTGNENLLIRLSGEIAQIRAALDAAEKLAPQLGASIVTGIIPRPADGFDSMIHFPDPPPPRRHGGKAGPSRRGRAVGNPVGRSSGGSGDAHAGARRRAGARDFWSPRGLFPRIRFTSLATCPAAGRHPCHCVAAW